MQSIKNNCRPTFTAATNYNTNNSFGAVHKVYVTLKREGSEKVWQFVTEEGPRACDVTL